MNVRAQVQIAVTGAASEMDGCLRSVAGSITLPEYDSWPGASHYLSMITASGMVETMLA